MKRVHVFVSGNVHGVFYRVEAARAARARGVAGWIRNTPDGRVEAVFEGEDSAVDAVVDWCHDGPMLAEVESVESTVEPTEGADGFEIR